MSNNVANISYCDETIKLKENIEGSYLTFGKRLLAIRDGQLYSGQWSSFPEYLAEMKITESNASKIINVYKKFVVEYGLSEESVSKAGIGNLGNVVAFVKDKDSAEHWLHLASTLSREDLQKETKEARTKISMADCPHLDSYTMKICRTCGDKIRVDETNLSEK